MKLPIPWFPSLLVGPDYTAAGWKRELWEWLMAVAAMIGAVWISSAVAQAIIDGIMWAWRRS